MLVGRSRLTEDRQAQLKALELAGVKVEYQRVDVAESEDVRELIAHIVRSFGTLNGIIHAAGVSRDSFILKKTAEQFREVLAAKVKGTVNLDEATRSLKLDFFTLFSSVAAFGNAGQADYAMANAFMDDYAGYRNECVSAGLGYGRTLSLNWPLWSEGGLTIDPASQDLIRKKSGKVAMPTAHGISAFYRAFSLDGSQVLVEEFERGWNPPRERTIAQDEPAETSREAAPDDGLKDRAVHYLRRLLAAVLKLPANRIQAHVPLEEYGLESIMINELNHRLQEDFGSLPQTLFFEYRTIGKIADYFLETVEGPLRALLGAAPTQSAAHPVRSVQPLAPVSLPLRPEGEAKPPSELLDIAIIGISGRYPRSRDVNAFWENLKAGVDCVTEVPEERWDWRQYYSEDPRQAGTHAGKWGGFIDDVDKFDALFFNISPREAELMDPQERLFLEHVWMAFEDAGCCRMVSQGGPESPASQVGVYVGVMYGEYQLFGAEASLRGQRMGFAGSLASIANRVSYVFDLHGPSMTVDSMCSSSLTSLHLACQDLKSGRINLGIAGGVNVTVHPNKYLMLSGLRFLSARGRCESFGEGGDGYVPGEGVGVVLLKRLADAERDGDQIYGVIKGSALNHGGRTNGYTVPNPAAQQMVIHQALRESRIDPRTITYVEAHGTGTKLGDPIEIAGLTKAFVGNAQTDSGGRSPNQPVCWIGSAKSNIGHAESAAGVAGVTKVLLQMKHRQIAPSLHSRILNASIDFSATPFSVSQQLQAWKRPVIDGVEYPRRAGISSFGATGSNAHVLIEEYEDSRSKTGLGATTGREFMIVLSAKNGDRLKEAVLRLYAHITAAQAPEAIGLADLAMTLQVGREAMEERLGFIVASTLQR
jgi:3-oxoacyl-(acyl-carrier-protein) synthase